MHCALSGHRLCRMSLGNKHVHGLDGAPPLAKRTVYRLQEDMVAKLAKFKTALAELHTAAGEDFEVADEVESLETYISFLYANANKDYASSAQHPNPSAVSNIIDTTKAIMIKINKKVESK